MGQARIPIPKDAIAPFYRKHHIRKLALFGSVLRGDFGPDSDVDVLVAFDPDHVPGWDVVSIAELADMLWAEVDMRTPEELSRYFRDEVVHEAEVQYAA